MQNIARDIEIDNKLTVNRGEGRGEKTWERREMDMNEGPVGGAKVG